MVLSPSPSEVAPVKLRSFRSLWVVKVTTERVVRDDDGEIRGLCPSPEELETSSCSQRLEETPEHVESQCRTTRAKSISS